MRGALSSLLWTMLQERSSEEPLCKAYELYSYFKQIPLELLDELLVPEISSSYQERESSVENFLTLVFLYLPQIEVVQERLQGFARGLIACTIYDEKLIQVEKCLVEKLLSIPTKDLFSLEAPFKELKSYTKEQQMLSFIRLAKYALFLQILGKVEGDSRYVKAAFDVLQFFKEIIDFESELLSTLWSNEREYESRDLFSYLYVSFEELSRADQKSDYSKYLELCKAKLEEKGSSNLLAVLAQDFLQKQEVISFETKELSNLFLKSLYPIRNDSVKALLTPFGFKTGFGSMLCGSVCIKAFGPQNAPLTASEFFGIYEPYHKKRIALLKDDNFKGWFQTVSRDNWLYFSIKSDSSSLHIKSHLQKKNSSSPLFFSFYLNADEIELNGRAIKRRELHGYQGLASELAVICKEERVSFSTSQEACIKVMALAGSGCFWDADFLVSYELKADGSPLLLTISR